MSARIRWCGSRNWTRRGDRGSAEPLFILPVVFVMVLGVVQVGVWAHAQHRVQAVASQTLASARALNGSTALAYQRAEQAQEQLGGAMLQRVEVDVTREPEQARVLVRAQAVSVVPGATLPVSMRVSGPIEHLAP
ncbi:TadE/TadG family type IV pilus assembly protein [Nocardiopsis kunsanensis]